VALGTRGKAFCGVDSWFPRTAGGEGGFAIGGEGGEAVRLGDSSFELPSDNGQSPAAVQNKEGDSF
jgi:hypothetical protein